MGNADGLFCFSVTGSAGWLALGFDTTDFSELVSDGYARFSAGLSVSGIGLSVEMGLCSSRWGCGTDFSS